MTISFAYKERKPTAFGYIDTWEWCAPEAIVNVGGVDALVTDIRAVRTQETADSYCEPIAGMMRDEVTFTTGASAAFHGAIGRGDGVLAVDDTRCALYVRDVVTTGGHNKPTVTHVTLVGRIYERGEPV